jgi:hypothetical protein
VTVPDERISKVGEFVDENFSATNAKDQARINLLREGCFETMAVQLRIICHGPIACAGSGPRTRRLPGDMIGREFWLVIGCGLT